MAYVDNDGVKIWFEVEGEGLPLMLIHGTTGNLNIWRKLGIVDALKSDYKMILVDDLGHGQSDKPHEPTAYLPDPKSKDIEAILDSLGIETTHYLGYSMGGRFGLDLVLLHTGCVRWWRMAFTKRANGDEFDVQRCEID
jgi:pimeloyl-ACP methyl ester carboxylesterase